LVASLFADGHVIYVFLVVKDDDQLLLRVHQRGHLRIKDIDIHMK
jgi:hypothetical protein